MAEDTALVELWERATSSARNMPDKPSHEHDAIIARAVGESGTAQITIGPCERGWLENCMADTNRKKAKAAVADAYAAAFNETPLRVAVVSLPYSEREDGDGEDD